MSKIRSLLMLSNGHGEDVIGAAILKELFSKESQLWGRVMPIVGEGNAYKNLPIKLMGPLKKLPTGGFMRQSLRNFFRDLRGGLLGHTYDQIQTLRKIRHETSLVVCVGDVLLVILAGFFVRKPMIFIPTAKSEYISGHYRIEKNLMKRFAKLVLPRDAKTAEVLLEAGVAARFVGNAMMDSFEVTDYDFEINSGARVVGILPGSRVEAYQNMKTILQTIYSLESLKVEPMDYLVALASQISVDIIERTANELGWFIEKSANSLTGIVAQLVNHEGVRVKLCKGVFGDVLQQSDIFIGLAGTANEQAVGMGKPVVAFPTSGAQFNQKFVNAQKKLLGDSISVVKPLPEKIAAEVLVILSDQERYQMMAQVGMERMGPKGGIGRMAEIILDLIGYD